MNHARAMDFRPRFDDNRFQHPGSGCGFLNTNGCSATIPEGQMRKLAFLATAAVILAVVGCDKAVPVTVLNDTGDYDLVDIYIYPAGQVSRGEDLQLTDLAPGEASVFRFVPGTYNILVIDEFDDSYIFDGVTIPAGGDTIRVTYDDWDSGRNNTGDGHIPLVIENALEDYEIYYLYVSPSSSGEWGDDVLADAGIFSIWTDETLTVWLEPGTYDVQAVDDYGYTFTYENVEITESAGATIRVKEEDIDTPRTETAGSLSVGTGTAPVNITNGLGSYDIWYAYVDPSDSPGGDDRLGSEILEPGSTLTVWVDPGTYDIMVEDVDGDTYTLWGVEVGAEGYDWEVTLSDMD